jgi:hypothetical protein
MTRSSDYTPADAAKSLVNQNFGVALVIAVALCLSALIPMLYHTSASFDGTSGPCIAAMSRASGNVNYVHITTQAGLDYNAACTSRVNTMEGVASALVVGGVVLGVVAFAYRRRAMRHLEAR